VEFWGILRSPDKNLMSKEKFGTQELIDKSRPPFVASLVQESVCTRHSTCRYC
jgi:hypothetical protein